MASRIIVFICLYFISISICACGSKVPQFSSEESEQSTSVEKTTTEYVEENIDTEETEMIPVYVCGAVNNPGVYYVCKGALKIDALEAAGGLCTDADDTKVNLAQTVTSGERIYFPYIGQNNEEISEDKDELSEGLDINSATKEELMTLPGIGSNKAEDIIAYREENGGFTDVSDIMNVDGIKEGVYNKIKDSICVK